MNSGIFIRIGTETKDLITECSVSEFLNWLRGKSISAFLEAKEYETTLKNPYFRIGLLLSLSSRYGIILYKVKEEFQSFLESV